MRSFKLLVVSAALFAAAQVVASEGDLSGRAYNGNEVRNMQEVLIGTVEDVRETDITVKPNSGTGNYIGGALGGIGGAALGSMVGQGKGRQLATIAGGLLGGVLGSNAGEAVSTEHKRGIEFVVTLRDGRSVAVTQELSADVANIVPGDRVRLIRGSNAVRLARLNTQAAPAAASTTRYETQVPRNTSMSF